MEKTLGILQKHKKIVTAGYNIQSKWKLFHLRLQAKSRDCDAHLRIYSVNVFSLEFMNTQQIRRFTSSERYSHHNVSIQYFYAIYQNLLRPKHREAKKMKGRKREDRGFKSSKIQ